MREVVLELDDLGVQALAAQLTALRRHLDHAEDFPTCVPSGSRLVYLMWEIRDQLGLTQMYNMGPPNPWLGAMTDPIALTLRLDAATAKDLEAALYDIGEHFAAGAPLCRASDDVEARIDAVLALLNRHRDENG